MPTNPLKTSQKPENEEITPEVEEVYKPDFVFVPGGRHIWRQEGPYLVCRDCGLHHAVFIGIENIMIGEDEQGKPIIKSKLEVFGE
jgi:hypothetical protein